MWTMLGTRLSVGVDALDADDKREISVLLKAIEGDIESYPFGPE